jgi:hypothetical protein
MMIKTTMLLTVAGLIGVAQVDPITAGGKLSQLGALGILGTCLVAVTLALVKKDKRANDLSDAQAAATREIATALQASTDAAHAAATMMVEVKGALHENTVAVRAMTKATEWCENVHRRESDLKKAAFLKQKFGGGK